MPEIRALRALAGASCALLVGLGVSGCSKHDSSAPSPSATASAQAVPLVVRLSTITGRLPVSGRNRLRGEVGRTIDGWWQAAYLSTGSSNAFPAASFTPGAAKLAKRDADLLSNAGMTGITAIEAKRREADLDILAVKGAARGITAVLHLTYDTSGGPSRRCAVGGTVSLTPSGAGWRIFGYDVTHTCRPRKAGS
ncbi:hypothetical protein GCM10028801_17860 [Nocardioides maradonensis]